MNSLYEVDNRGELKVHMTIDKSRMKKSFHSLIESPFNSISNERKKKISNDFLNNVKIVFV